jgi:hypothetical protein
MKPIIVVIDPWEINFINREKYNLTVTRSLFL